MDTYVNAAEVLEFAVRIEENGGEFYQSAIKLIDDEAIRKQLQSLAGWEENHIAQIRSVIGSIAGAESEFPLYFSPEEDSSLYIKALADQYVFVRSESIEGVVKECRSVQDILALALRFEKDSVNFYRSIESKLRDETAKKAIGLIAYEEETHVAQVQKLIAEVGSRL